MFRSRPRPETSSRSTSRRGSVGSASVWDERTRAARAAGRAIEPPPAEAPPPAPPLALPAGELAALIAGIVEVTLDTRFTHDDPARRAELARELEARLMALFGATPGIEARKESPRDAPGGPSPVPREGGPEATSSAHLAELATPAERALGQALEERLARLGGALATRPDLRARLIALALERRPVPPASGVSGQELGGLDVLRRRAAKLERSLQETRAALAYVSGLEHFDPGIASIHRGVQGLSLEDPQRERKRAALECLFRSNLALQRGEADQRVV